MKKIIETKLRKLIRKILMENSKVASIESDYLDKVKTGSFEADDGPDQ